MRRIIIISSILLLTLFFLLGYAILFEVDKMPEKLPIATPSATFRPTQVPFIPSRTPTLSTSGSNAGQAQNQSQTIVVPPQPTPTPQQESGTIEGTIDDLIDRVGGLL